MNPARSLFLTALFLLMVLAAFLWLQPQLPASIPVHWNAQNHIDGYATPVRAVVTPMCIIIGLALLTVLLPLISPHGFEIKPFLTAFTMVMLAVQAFVVLGAVGTLLNAAGHSTNGLFLRMLPLGLLMMVIGNYMGKLRKNFFIGIRTPWTLASDTVWERTHRFGGWVFMLAGVIVAIAAFANVAPCFSISVLLVAAAITVVYSYVIYQRVER